MKLKLSDAILMGSTLIRFDPSLYLNADGNCGCLIGMGGKAIGKTRLTANGDFTFPEYPWLFDKFPWPAGIGLKSLEGKLYPAYTVIGEMARRIKEGKYTFELALEWIRANEPQESVTSSADNEPSAKLCATLADSGDAPSTGEPRGSSSNPSADSLYSVSEHKFAHSEHVMGRGNVNG